MDTHMKKPGTAKAGHRVERPVFSRIYRALASRSKSALGAQYIDSGLGGNAPDHENPGHRETKVGFMP